MRVIAVVGLAVVSLLVVDAARAQWGRVVQRPGQNMAGAIPLEAKGTIEKMSQENVVQMTSESKQTWFLKFGPETRVEIAGKGKPDLLSPGYYVWFQAKVAGRSARIAQKVSKFVVFIPCADIQEGAAPASEAGEGFERALSGTAHHNLASLQGGGMNQAWGGGMGMNPGMAGRGGRAARGFGGGQPPGDGQDPAAAPDAGTGRGKKGGKASTEGETYDIRGRITSVKNGKVKLSAPNSYFKSPLTFELGDELEVGVDIIGLAGQIGGQFASMSSLLHGGDKIEGRGHQATENGALVNEMHVTLAEPLAGEAPAGKKARGRSASARAKKTQDAESPADDADAKPKKKAARKPKDAESDDAPAMSADDADAKPKKKAARKPKDAESDDAPAMSADDDPPVKPKKTPKKRKPADDADSTDGG
jgi:hypothetical protein